jgi:hypothetical protein
MLKKVMALSLGGALAVAEARAQSMAAAAEKEKERRAKQQQTSGPSGKTYDDGTLATTGGTLANDPSIPPAAPPSSSGGSRGGTPRSVFSASGSSSASSGAGAAGSGEAYWRSRAQQLRAAVTSAEAQLKKAESDAQRAGIVTPGPRAAPCQAGAERLRGEGSIALRERSKKNVTCDAEGQRQETAQTAQGQVAAAQRALDKARADLSALDEQARRAGAQPGWIR